MKQVIHSKEDFKTFMSQLKETNATLSFYSDFDKVSSHVEDIAINLNTLNYLVGKKDLRAAVEALWRKDKDVFQVMDILIATRKSQHKMFVDDSGASHLVHSLFNSVDGIMEFMQKTGLAKVFQEQKIKDLEDYVFGVETGMDTHARKNRSGDIMEILVQNIFNHSNVPFEFQVSSEERLPKIQKVLGKDNKVFDFMIETNAVTYLIEVNFYNGSGSKPNEVTRSYIDINNKVNSVDGYEFVWITDGKSWEKGLNKIEEAYFSIPNMYNLTSIQDFIASLRFN